ncbi:MAG: peptidoglycan-binding protein [Candidatus Vogelbacteria bacterium]|nr:peptidoglycan-binding protein [Candidatus Vogelbacteria bacterium]
MTLYAAVSEEFTGQSAAPPATLVISEEFTGRTTAPGDSTETLTVSEEFSGRTRPSAGQPAELVISAEFAVTTKPAPVPPIPPIAPLVSRRVPLLNRSSISSTTPISGLAISEELVFLTGQGPSAPPTGGGGGGGNGGGGGGGGGSGAGQSRSSASEPTILPRPCPIYLTKFIKFGAANDQTEVRKLQLFLRDYEGFSALAITGVYDPQTLGAVMIFQTRYREAILKPWGIDYPTGYVYITTSLAINNLYCERDPANDLDLRQPPARGLWPGGRPAATSTATTTWPLPEVGVRDQNLWQAAALGLLDFIRNHPWWWLMLVLFLLLLVSLGFNRDKDKAEKG